MNKIKCKIWGREFELPVDFDVFPGEEIINQQKEALREIISQMPVSLEDTHEIEKYCKQVNPKEIPNGLDNVFKYVMPTSFYIKRSEEKHIVALLCNYKFDEENGIALIFENKKLLKIGIQDIIL